MTPIAILFWPAAGILLRRLVPAMLLGYFGQVSGKKAFIIEAFLFHQFAELVGGEA